MRIPRASAGLHLPGIFLATAGRRAHEPAIRTPGLSGPGTLSWAETERLVRLRAAGLVELGVGPGARVLLVADAGRETALCQLAIQAAGAVAVPVYPSLPLGALAQVARETEAQLALAEGEALDRIVASGLPGVRTIVAVGAPGSEATAATGVLDLPSLDARGEGRLAAEPAALDDRLAGLDPDGLATILYTSGTGGDPRGVELTHRGWAFQADAIARLGLAHAGDETFLFLPPAHVFGQLAQAVWLRTGMTASFGRGLDTVLEDLAAARPTVLASVPRLFEAVHAQVVAEGLDHPGARGRLFSWGIDEYERWLERREPERQLDRATFLLARRAVLGPAGSRIRSRLGGRVRTLISGGAPLSCRTAWFFEAAGLPLLDGYGLTEAGGAVTLDRPDRLAVGTVGPPLPCMHLRIAEDGEVWIKGPSVMLGYHRRPEDTAEILDADGWLRTGDLGVLEDDGHLRLTGRKRDVVVTAGGKRVAPEPLEQRLAAHPLVSRVVVHGERRRFLGALITLDERRAMTWAQEHGVPFEGLEAFARRPELLAVLRSAVDEVNAAAAHFERIERFAVLPRDLSSETGELGPNGKVRRHAVEARWSDVLDAFYNDQL